MIDTPIKMLFLAAVMLNSMLCGASLDLSVKQLPSRHVVQYEHSQYHFHESFFDKYVIPHLLLSYKESE